LRPTEWRSKMGRDQCTVDVPTGLGVRSRRARLATRVSAGTNLAGCAVSPRIRPSWWLRIRGALGRRRRAGVLLGVRRRRGNLSLPRDRLPAPETAEDPALAAEFDRRGEVVLEERVMHALLIEHAGSAQPAEPWRKPARAAWASPAAASPAWRSRRRHRRHEPQSMPRPAGGSQDPLTGGGRERGTAGLLTRRRR